MSLDCGIVGLPNVGKSTIFTALTAAPAAAENFPFCTIDPNIGIVDLPDERLEFLAGVFQPKKITPTSVKFVDIAGLIKGASQGEGLGNQFLANIREVTCIAHVVRCFDNPDIMHVRENANTAAPIDPEGDISTINMELALADLDTIKKRQEKVTKATRALGREEEKKWAPWTSAVGKIKPLLEAGKCARQAELSEEEKAAVQDMFLLTIKPTFYVCNVDEDTIASGTNKYVEIVKQIAADEKSEVIVICGKFEADLADIKDANDRKEFMDAVGLKESGLAELAHTAYKLMGLRTSSREARTTATRGRSTRATRRRKQQAPSTRTLKKDSSKRKPTRSTTYANTAVKQRSRNRANTGSKAKITSYRTETFCSLNSARLQNNNSGQTA